MSVITNKNREMERQTPTILKQLSFFMIDKPKEDSANRLIEIATSRQDQTEEIVFKNSAL